MQIQSAQDIAGGRIFAIGDIHGCLHLLQTLVERLPFRPAEDTLLFLGDYIDRGPASAEVIAYLLALQARLPRTVFLAGNHERMFLACVEAQRDTDLYLQNGGGATLAAYGIPHPAQASPSRIPPAHWRFFQGLRLVEERERHLFVHAGLRPGIPLTGQSPDDLVWIREEFFLSSERFDKTVVFGHTPFVEPLVLPDRIGIDTGAVYGGRLTCVELPARRFYQA